jgi:mersacidin/lichenicidin family type 2 lantibiotic
MTATAVTEASLPTARPSDSSEAIEDLLVTVDVVRAWRDLAYREHLTPAEREMLAPHPSGEINLTGTELDPVLVERHSARMLRRNTWTIDSICCSTGDLPCWTEYTCVFSCSGTCA